MSRKITKQRQKKNHQQESRTKLIRLFKRNNLKLVGLSLQSIQVLETYIKMHIVDGEPLLLREICRMVLRLLPKSPQKTRLRGILGNDTRIINKKPTFQFTSPAQQWQLITSNYLNGLRQ